MPVKKAMGYKTGHKTKAKPAKKGMAGYKTGHKSKSVKKPMKRARRGY